MRSGILARDKAQLSVTLCSILCLVFTFVRCQDAPATLVAHYPANAETEANPPGNYLNQGVTLVPDRFGNASEAYYFYGEYQRIYITNPEYLPFTGDFTFAFWVKAGPQERVQPISSGSLDADNFDIDLTTTSTWVYWNGGGDPGIISAHNALDNAWHHIVVTRNNSKVEFYINGVNVGSRTYHEPVGSATELLIGGRGEFIFGGYMDDILIFNSGFKEADVKALYTQKPFFILPDTTTTWISGHRQLIQLRATRAQLVDLEVSYDNGQSWTIAASGLSATDALYEWEVPLVEAATISRFRLRDTELNEIVCTSEAFTIKPAGISESYQWQLVTDAAAFSPRDGAGAVEMDGEMWLFGGWNPEIYSTYTTNEIWKSPDGAAWTSMGVAPWEGRHAITWLKHDNKVYMVGGDNNQERYQTDAWVSANGTNWTQLVSELPWTPRASHMVASYDSKIWMAGGQQFIIGNLEGDTVFNDVWRSNDGENWQMVTDAAPWTGRGFGGLISFQNKLWLLGGARYNEPKIYYNDVWTTTDGVNWVPMPNAPWRPRMYHQTLIYDDKLWVLGGFGDNNKNLGDVWYTEDGINWTEVRNTPWAPRHAATGVVFQDALYYMCGTTNNTVYLSNEVWKLSKYLDVDLNVNKEVILYYGDSLIAETTSYPNLQYSWQRNGAILESETAARMIIKEDGEYSVTVQDPLTGLQGTSEKVNVLIRPNAAINVKNDTVVTLSPYLLVYAHYDSTYQYRWYYNGKLMPDETHYVLKARFEGDYFLVVEAPNGLTASSDTINVSIPVGFFAIAENQLVVENQNDAYANVYFIDQYAYGPVRLTVYDTNGRQLYSEENAKTTPIQYFSVDISRFARGMFIALIESTRGSSRKKFLKN